ncbi:unnamed protein product, partial [Linum tenue]
SNHVADILPIVQIRGEENASFSPLPPRLQPTQSLPLSLFDSPKRPLTLDEINREGFDLGLVLDEGKRSR